MIYTQNHFVSTIAWICRFVSVEFRDENSSNLNMIKTLEGKRKNVPEQIYGYARGLLKEIAAVNQK